MAMFMNPRIGQATDTMPSTWGDSAVGPPNAAAQGTQPMHVPEEPTDPRDALTSLVGPNICGYFKPDEPLPRPSHPVSEIEKWISGANNATKLNMFVSLSARTLELAVITNPTIGEKSIGVPDNPLSSTHYLCFQCDSASPQSSINVYMHNERQDSDGKVLTAPAIAHAGSGWLIHSQRLQRGIGMRVKVPLTLSGMQRVDMSIVLEALDDDGAPLIEQSVLTTQVCVLNETSGWLVRANRQVAHIGTHALQLRELYGFRGEAPGANADESGVDTSHDALVADSGEGEDCPICISQPPTTLILPCTHALCLECAVHVRDSVEKRRMNERQRGRAPRVQYACPICRGPIKSMLTLSDSDN